MICSTTTGRALEDLAEASRSVQAGGARAIVDRGQARRHGREHRAPRTRSDADRAPRGPGAASPTIAKGEDLRRCLLL